MFIKLKLNIYVCIIIDYIYIYTSFTCIHLGVAYCASMPLFYLIYIHNIYIYIYMHLYPFGGSIPHIYIHKLYLHIIYIYMHLYPFGGSILCINASFIPHIYIIYIISIYTPVSFWGKHTVHQCLFHTSYIYS